MNRWQWVQRSELKYVRNEGLGKEEKYRQYRLFLLRGKEKRNVYTCRERERNVEGGMECCYVAT
jgi:hypothetical protein